MSLILSLVRNFLQTTNSAPSLPIVKANLKYFKILPIHTHEKPYLCEFSVRGLPDARQSNIELESHQVAVNDIRGSETRFTLERNGFEIMRHQSSLSLDDFTLPSAIESRYLAECQQLVQQQCDASRVVVLGYNVRDNSPGLNSKFKSAMRPFETVHIDQSPTALYARLVQQFGPEEAERLSRKHRCLIINVWRALSDPVEDFPLTYCDIQTVNQSDCVAVDLVKRDNYEGETLYLRYNPRHQWYYLSEQRPHEVLLMKMAESCPTDPGSYHQGLPHTAFELPVVENGPIPKPRESIEVRTLVLI